MKTRENQAFPEFYSCGHSGAALPRPERIRHHTCYGINMGPRTNDLEFRHVVDLVLTIRANFYSFEAANPRQRA